MKRLLLFCIGSIVAATASGQCPGVGQLATQFRTISQQPFAEQEKSLMAWTNQWTTCGYRKDSVYANALLQIGMGHFLTGDLPASIQAVQQAVTICRADPVHTRPADLSKALYRLGVVYSVQNQINKAITVLKEAVAVGRDKPETATWVGNAHLYLAYAYETMGDYQQTLAHADVGFQVAAPLANKPLLANLLRQKAQALNALQQYDKAQQAVEQAIALIRDDKSLTAALTDNYSLLSVILGYKNQHEPAILYAQKAFDLAQTIQYAQTPNLATRLGFLYFKAGAYAKAITYSQYGSQHSTDAFKKAEALSLAGEANWKQRRFVNALSFYQQGLRIIPINFGQHRLEKNPAATTVRLVAHKGIFLNLIESKADTWLDYAKATANKQYLRNALDTYKVADQMIDFMRWEHTGQQSKLYWRQKTRGMYERAIETCYRLGDANQAFRFLEKSRAVMLADKLNELGARQQLAPQQIDQEQQLRQSVGDQQAKLARLAPDSASYASVRARLLTKQDSLDTFLKHLEASNPAYYRYKYDNETTSLADLQRYLSQQQRSFVTYFVGDSALYTLGVTGDTAILYRQPVQVYKQQINQFATLLGNPDAMSKRSSVNRFLGLSNSLYHQLLAPLALPKGRVIVSPDGFFVPFDALSRSGTQPQYAVSDYAFSYAYSASLLLKKTPTKPQLPGLRTGDFLGMAPVDFAPSLRQVTLPGSGEALKSIANHFGSSETLTHEAATRRAFEQKAPHYRVVHLFTHAVADSTNAEPKLYFADSTLQLSDLGDNVLPNAQLVVLAACKTGIGANERGEGVFSLARGFSALGVPSVLTTLWSVQNDATYKLTNLFYGYLEQGLPKDIALQRAKQDWLNTASGADQLPNYWAGLIVVGDTEPLSRTNYWLLIMSLIGVVVAGLGGWRLWRQRHIRQPVEVARKYRASHPVSLKAR